jgi:hypothetical protein
VSKRRARAVLELSAGESSRRGVKVGDRLELRDRVEVEAPRMGSPGSADADADVDASTEAAGPALDRRGGELVRLRPLRILIISSDRRFRTVMSLLLARRNCSVTTTANAGRVGELIARENTDVVVIDIGELQTAAAIATVGTLALSVGVVLVADETSPNRSSSAAIAKWGPFEEFVEAIERADADRGAHVAQS